MTTGTEESGFCILKPHTVTDAMLASSSVYEVAPADYAPGTSYGAGVDVAFAGALGLITVYRSQQGSNLGHAPDVSPLWWKAICTLYQAYSLSGVYALGERVQDNAAHLIYESQADANTGNALSDVTKWLVVGATNARAAFDNEIGTATAGASPLVQVMRPGSTDGIILLDVVARTGAVVMRDGPGGTIVFNRQLDFDATRIERVFDWFFADQEFMTGMVLTDLPAQYASCELTVTLNTTSGDASAGVIKPGRVIDIGPTRLGAKVGIQSRTKLNENDFGNLQIVRRPSSKKGSFTITTEKSRFNIIYRTLKSLDGILCAYIPTSVAGLEEAAMYGLFSDFSIVIEQKKKHVCSLDIKGSI